MKREHLFEFEDLPWFPSVLRDQLTEFMNALHRLLGTGELLAPLLARALDASGTDEVVDLASGAGGPLPSAVQRLREHGRDVRLTLTDLYPNEATAQAVEASEEPAVRYWRGRVDAADVPDELEGVRTMVASFHHMPPPAARGLLADARAKGEAVLVLELAPPAWPTWLAALALPAAALGILLLTPFVRPNPKQLSFTYVFPVLPIVMAWDAAATLVRLYSRRELEDKLDGLGGEDYVWEFGALRRRWLPQPMPYLLGLPVRDADAARGAPPDRP